MSVSVGAASVTRPDLRARPNPVSSEAPAKGQLDPPPQPSPAEALRADMKLSQGQEKSAQAPARPSRPDDGGALRKALDGLKALAEGGGDTDQTSATTPITKPSTSASDAADQGPAASAKRGPGKPGAVSAQEADLVARQRREEVLSSYRATAKPRADKSAAPRQLASV